MCFFFFLMIRRPPRSTQGVSSAASDVYKRQLLGLGTYDWKGYKTISSEKNKMIIYQNGNSNNGDSITSDDYFTYLTQTLRPELAIGRYPAKNTSELDLSLIHISEPTRPLYISYAVFCLKKKKKTKTWKQTTPLPKIIQVKGRSARKKRK
eukprot:TRINITY_DN44103_c0_g1_i1.p1 TRINITY_DN44103_c0_g1~~TRINITY_DN44103_c0_g1_i1.p1  ORF type:complete len:151 (-),score=35.79 TRINITY_DN44103_c0_g1_i1:51-503(-)